jgi:hypothetical protein
MTLVALGDKMKCFYHTEYDSVTTCSKCGQPICKTCHSIGDIGHAVCLTCWEKIQLEDQAQRKLELSTEKELKLSQVAGTALAALALGLVITCANQMLSMAQRMLKTLKASHN